MNQMNSIDNNLQANVGTYSDGNGGQFTYPKPYVCPTCGICPTCGRSHFATLPYPNWYNNQAPSVTCY